MGLDGKAIRAFCITLLKKFIYWCTWTSSTMHCLDYWVFLCTYNMFCNYYCHKNHFICILLILATLFHSIWGIVNELVLRKIYYYCYYLSCILQNNKLDDAINVIENVKHMVPKNLNFGIKQVFSSCIVYNKRVTLQVLEDIHKWLVSLSKELDISYIDNRNIRRLQLFKDILYTSESGETMSINNFISNLNNFLSHTPRPTNCRHLTENVVNNRDTNEVTG